MTFVSDSFKSFIQRYCLFIVRLFYVRKQFPLLRNIKYSARCPPTGGGQSYIFSMDIEFALHQHLQTGPGDHPVGTFYTPVMKPESDT